MDWNRHFILNDVFSFGLVGFIACIGNHFSVGYLDAISLTGISTVPKKKKRFRSSNSFRLNKFELVSSDFKL